MARKKLPLPFPTTQPSPSSSSSSSSEDEDTPSPPRPPPSLLHSQTPKKQKPSPTPKQSLPSSPSSSEEEDSDSEDEAQDTDPEPSPPTTKVTAPAPQPPKKVTAPPLPSNNSSSSSESESESDPEPDHRPQPPAPPPPKSPAKKPAEKKRKAPENDATPANGPSGKKLFERLWNAGDEITLLKGMLEFQAKHGHEPSNSPDVVVLIDMLRDVFHAGYSIAQIMSKIRHMKQKYTRTLTKERAGIEPVFASEHAKSVYEMSKKIWGDVRKAEKDAGEDGERKAGLNDDGKKGPVRKKGKAVNVTASPAKKNAPVAVANDVNREGAGEGVRGEEVEGGVLNSAVGFIVDETVKYGGSSVNITTLKMALGLMKPEVVTGLVEKLKECHVEEVNLCCKRLELTMGILKMVAEVLGNSRN